MGGRRSGPGRAAGRRRRGGGGLRPAGRPDPPGLRLRAVRKVRPDHPRGGHGLPAPLGAEPLRRRRRRPDAGKVDGGDPGGGGGLVQTKLDAPFGTLDANEQKFVATIREHGWFSTHILEEDGLPGFSFTTGFWLEQRFPEIILFSIPRHDRHEILWDLYRDILDGDLPPIGAPAPLLGQHPGVLMPVARKNYAEHLGWCMWFYQGEDFPCLQLFWPDRWGRFPWEEGCDPEVVELQPNLTDTPWR
ncbi:MAG: DUF4262 domain-containing protein [Caulobacteraceae bacterium]|nr:MAG: DUF4262 domain-containing protein [Caulobacteraceae bacterium]